MTLKDSALRVAILTALRDAIASEQEIARSEALIDISDAADSMGVKAVDITLSGERIGTLTLAGGQAKPAVVDETLFLNWVKTTHPTEVETVERVRPAYLAAVLKAEGVDTATGEVVPGVEARERTRYTSVRFAPEGREAVAAAWRRGELQAVAFPEVEA